MHENFPYIIIAYEVDESKCVVHFLKPVLGGEVGSCRKDTFRVLNFKENDENTIICSSDDEPEVNICKGSRSTEGNILTFMCVFLAFQLIVGFLKYFIYVLCPVFLPPYMT